MILLDLNQTMISNLMMQIGMSKGENLVEEGMVRHMVLNSLRSYRKKFSEEYGELVICCDDKNYWRKKLFPLYKASRKKSREESPLDWNVIFGILNRIRDEIRDHMPYKVIQIESAEADDVIASICHKYGTVLNTSDSEKILIISGDKDFTQLQRYANVYQYSPILKKMLNTNNPERYLLEHIILGDKGDGVPNILSDDDCIVNENKRQKSISRVKMEKWVLMDPKEFCENETILRNYNRNKTMIDFFMIPSEIQDQCIDAYENTNPAPRSGVLNYFIQSRLSTLTEKLGDF